MEKTLRQLGLKKNKNNNSSASISRSRSLEAESWSLESLAHQQIRMRFWTHPFQAKASHLDLCWHRIESGPPPCCPCQWMQWAHCLQGYLLHSHWPWPTIRPSWPGYCCKCQRVTKVVSPWGAGHRSWLVDWNHLHQPYSLPGPQSRRDRPSRQHSKWVTSRPRPVLVHLRSHSHVETWRSQSHGDQSMGQSPWKSWAPDSPRGLFEDLRSNEVEGSAGSDSCENLFGTGGCAICSGSIWRELARFFSIIFDREESLSGRLGQTPKIRGQGGAWGHIHRDPEAIFPSQTSSHAF